MMRCAIYVRCSTLDQSLDVQLDNLREYARKHAWDIRHEFTDHGVSGKLASRPGLDKLMHMAELKQFDVVLVWDYSRFGRNLVNNIQNIEHLESLGIKFVAAKQDIDTTGSMGKLVVRILSVIAEFEREQILERTDAGRKHAQKNGVKFGPKFKPFDEQKALKYLARGESHRKIAERVGVHRGIIDRWARRQTSVPVLR